MIYKFLTLEKKSPEWIVATLQEGIENGQTFANVSINKNDKNTKAVAFPSFDTFAVGQTVEGQYWANAQGKGYLFAPKVQVASRANNMQGVKAAQERKQEMIKESQETKSQAIKVSAAMRDATLLTIELMKNDLTSDWKDKFQEIKLWYLQEWNATEKSVDIPFN